jgi:hypothetical protein
MNKQPKLWELLAAFLPIIGGVLFWVWNLSTTVSINTTKINYLETTQEKQIKEYHDDTKEIKEDIKAILIELQNKEDRK